MTTPTDMEDLYAVGAGVGARLVREGVISAEQWMHACLERVRKVKTRHQRLFTRVTTIREELQRFLEDDDDMAKMCLTRKRELELGAALGASPPLCGCGCGCGCGWVGGAQAQARAELGATLGGLPARGSPTLQEAGAPGLDAAAWLGAGLGWAGLLVWGA